MTDDDSSSLSWILYPGETVRVSGGNRSDGNLVHVHEESVTFIVHLETDEGMVPPNFNYGSWVIGKWNIPDSHIPIIVGVSFGVILLLLIIAILIAWRCCKRQRLREKEGLDNGVESGKTPTSSGSSFPSTSSSSSKPDSPLTKAKRSHLPVSNCEMVHLSGRKAQSIKELPVRTAGDSWEESQAATAHSFEDISQVGRGRYVAFDLPDIDAHIHPSCCASSSVLDVPWAGNGSLMSELEHKSRSLPGWARNKGLLRATVQQETSVKDQGLDATACHSLVAQQSTSNNKRSSFVLGHDTAALIALSKSQQHQQAHFNSTSERVSLVQNEAVIVYTERTAL